MNLWFENRYGDRKVIAKCETLEEVYRAINKFIENANARRSKGTKPFKSYYIRSWQEEGFTKFDVGSHVEFFLWEGKVASLTMNKDGEARFSYE